MSEPAKTIIKKFGGFIEVAKICGVDVSRVHRWTYPQNRGGSNGFIPVARQDELLAEAKRRRIKLKRDDFFTGAR